MVYEVLVPVLLGVLVERVLVYRYLRTPRQLDWVRRQWWLNPNAISRSRYPMGFVTVAIFHYGWTRTAFLFFAFWMITDLTDGEIARRCGLSSEKGETIDPLSDKLMYTPLLLYFSWRGHYEPWLVFAFIACDVLGQASRSFIPNKAANLFGKAKTFQVMVLLGLTTADLIYGPLSLARLERPLLGFCTGLAVCSTAFKIIPNYWYANILSLMNLVCGLAGLWVLAAGLPHEYALGLVFLGQFLDLFDGRAAEKWGSTPRGEVFDDVADGTSFGATVGLLVATSFAHRGLGIVVGVVHVVATTYRLVRFVVEKRQAGVQGGVKTFSGMPSPGAALLTGTGVLLVPWDWGKAAVVFVTAALMVSRVPYPHFGRAILPRIPKLARVLVLAAFIVLLAQGVRTGHYDEAIGVAFVVALFYLACPLFFRSE